MTAAWVVWWEGGGTTLALTGVWDFCLKCLVLLDTQAGHHVCEHVEAKANQGLMTGKREASRKPLPKKVCKLNRAFSVRKAKIQMDLQVHQVVLVLSWTALGPRILPTTYGHFQGSSTIFGFNNSPEQR